MGERRGELVPKQPLPEVLIVEDDPAIAEVTALLLEQEGYPVATAANGAEALDAIALHMPDLILLDLKMPIMDGSTFLREFRRRYGPARPVVLLSASISSQAQAADLEVAGYLEKPFELEDLLQSVQRFSQAPPAA